MFLGLIKKSILQIPISNNDFDYLVIETCICLYLELADLPNFNLLNNTCQKGVHAHCTNHIAI